MRTLIVVLVLCAAAAGAVWYSRVAGSRSVEPTPARPIDEPGARSEVDEALVWEQIESFCGDCHATPRPESFPRKAWPSEVQRGYRFYFTAGRTDLVVPPTELIVDYYRKHAPDELVPVVDEPVAPLSAAKFTREIPNIESNPVIPAMSFVGWHAGGGSRPPMIMACDMWHGDVGFVELGRGSWRFETWGKASHPARIEPADLDHDGLTDYLVAALGSYLPEDHDQGQVVWMHQTAPGGAWQTTVLQSGLGRVADVRPADFDSDGDTDLIVAEFGFIRSGRIVLLRNTSSDRSTPKFELEVIDDRHGTIHVPVVDLDGDGRLDFLALVSQEYEVIEAFLNRGDGGFQRETIYAARDPSYGSSGMQLVDFDRDGDLDILYTNGDTLDSHFLKPYHSIQWLENQGSFPWTHHHLASMPGVSRAVAADIDLDGDLDVAAAAYFPESLRNVPGSDRLDIVLWLEQVAPMSFARHRLEAGTSGHLCLDAGDIDGDGDIDLVVGNNRGNPKSASRVEQRLAIWRNGLRE